MENNVYKVIFTYEGPAEEQKAVASNPSDTEGEATKSSSFENALAKKITPMAMIGYAKSIAGRAITTYIGTVSLRTGYEEKQQREQFIYSTASSIGNIALSIAAGAKFGGGWGAAIGAVVSVGNEAIGVVQREYQRIVARGQENTAIFLNQIRMGAGGRREGKTQ